MKSLAEIQASRRYRKKHREKIRKKYLLKYARNRAREKARSRRYYWGNKREVNNRRLLKEYGISASEFLEIKRRQGFRCGICRKRKKLCVDHCHKSGKVRGALCGLCNTGIGALGDSVNRLLRAKNYIREFKCFI